MLPGQSGDYIVIPTHVDGYFYGIHDNAIPTGDLVYIDPGAMTGF